ncbi:MAG: hypothetical protein JSW62_01645, partial [Thermoplasmatales archaeon]
MDKKEKYKKNNVKDLHRILENVSIEDLDSKDKKYLMSLSRRLEKSYDITYKKVESNKDKQKRDLLAPTVKIYSREKKSKIEHKEFYETEKTKADMPEFIEVKPKKTIKKAKKKQINVFKESENLQSKNLPEWKLAGEELHVTESKEEPTKIDIDIKISAFKDMNSIDKNIAVLLYDNNIISVNELKELSLKDLIRIKGIKKRTARKIKEELDKKEEESLKVKNIEIGKSAEGELKKEMTEENEASSEFKKEKASPVELKVESSEWEPTLNGKVKDEPIEWEFEKNDVELDEEKNKKTIVFKDFNSIDENTAILLYDAGFISTDELMIASIKDLTKIKGIKRKIAKKIKKEIDEKNNIKSVEKEGNFEAIINDKEESKERFIDEDFEGKDYRELDGKILEYESTTNDQDIQKEGDSEIEIDAFKDINSIDQKIAKLLYENGISCIGDLIEKNIKDLT